MSSTRILYANLFYARAHMFLRDFCVSHKLQYTHFSWSLIILLIMRATHTMIDMFQRKCSRASSYLVDVCVN